MKKFSLTIPFFVLVSIFNMPLLSLEAGGCSSHKNQNIQTKCLTTDENCKKLKSNNKQDKVDI